MKMLFRSIARIAAVTVAAAVPLGAAAQDKIALRLDWNPWGSHSPFHLAQAKGWFKQNNLEVEIEDGNGSVNTVQIVGGGGKFDVGHASLASMMVARDKGLGVRAVAVFVRRNDIGLLVPKGSGMRTPKDLVGKKLIYTAGSLEAPFLDSFLAAGGLKREQVELVNVDAAAKVGTYVAGRGDGVFSTVPFVLPAVAASRASDAIYFADHGLAFPSFGLLTSEAKLAEKRAAISRFASVVAGAWAYIAAGHQDEAAKAVVAARPQARLDVNVVRAQIDALIGMFETPASKGLPTGVLADADWAAGIKTLVDGKLIKGGSPGDFYAPNMIDAALSARVAGSK